MQVVIFVRADEIRVKWGHESEKGVLIMTDCHMSVESIMEALTEVDIEFYTAQQLRDKPTPYIWVFIPVWARLGMFNF